MTNEFINEQETHPSITSCAVMPAIRRRSYHRRWAGRTWSYSELAIA